ncbi:MAG: AI-2E family transporter, partial [Bradymonadaceae bacterium]
LGAVYGFSGLDIQSGVVIGLLTGFLNVIPYFGFAVGSVLAVLVTLIDWGGWGPVVGVLACFTVIQLVESYYITPKVVGDKVGLKPVTVIIVLLVGGHVAGLMGVLLAIPVAGAVKVLIPDIVKWYEKSSMYTGIPVVPAILQVEAGSGGHTVTLAAKELAVSPPAEEPPAEVKETATMVAPEVEKPEEAAPKKKPAPEEPSKAKADPEPSDENVET